MRMGGNEMKILVLGDNTYEESGSANYGDCFLIDNGEQLVIYDCGSTEHAEVVLKYMEKNKHDNMKKKIKLKRFKEISFYAGTCLL